MSKEFKSFFKTVGGNEGNKCHYPTRLDTYGCGCSHDCKYCYAKSLLDFYDIMPKKTSMYEISKLEDGMIVIDMKTARERKSRNT